MKQLKLLILLLICIVVAGGAFLYPREGGPSYPTEECSNIFSSSIYSRYLNQLRTFLTDHPCYEAVKGAVPTPFNSGVQSLIEVIEQPLPADQDLRVVHRSWVGKLRQLIEQNGNIQNTEKPSNVLLNDLIRWMYSGAELHSEIGDYFYAYSPALEGDFLIYLKEARDRLRAEGLFKGMGNTSKHEDNFLHGNLPYFLFTPPASPSTRLIRMGHPGGDFIGHRFALFFPAIYPEFLAFLRLQPSHLYVNLMKRKGIEAPITGAIELLEGQFPNVFVVTLDKNSSFYWQDEKKYVETMKSGEFRAEFIEKMISSKGNYFWSNRLEPHAWKEELETLLSEVHQDYFSGKEELNRIERQDFIELAYLAILDRLVEKLKPASMNISCRQGMDRGPSLAILWMHQKNGVKEGEVPAMLLAPPLLIHNRPSHASRIDRFISAAHRINDYPANSNSR